MADPTPAPDTPATPPVVVKKYANRRLYNTETSSYITLDNLAEMIRHGRDFVVYDAKSSEDITRGVLTQIIVEEESKGTSMLPTAFLRQLIGFYGDSLQGVVPRYLETAMTSFARQQQQLREVVQQTFSPFMPASVEEISRQNMAVIERTMSMFNPFHRGSAPLPPVAAEPLAPASGATLSEPAAPALAEAPVPHEAQAELDRLRGEVETLRAQLASAQAAAAEVAAAQAAAAPPPGTAPQPEAAAAPQPEPVAAPVPAPVPAPVNDAPNVRMHPSPDPHSQPPRRGGRRRLTQS